MATYEVTGPDGELYEFDGPDDATEEQLYAYAESVFGGTPEEEPQEAYDPYTAYAAATGLSGNSDGSNTSEDAIGSGQFFLEMIVGAVVLAVIISLYKVHNLMWIPVVGFLIGYLMSQDTSYVFSNVFGGLTFSMLCSIIAGIWIQRQKKKGE